MNTAMAYISFTDQPAGPVGWVNAIANVVRYSAWPSIALFILGRYKVEVRKILDELPPLIRRMKSAKVGPVEGTWALPPEEMTIPVGPKEITQTIEPEAVELAGRVSERSETPAAQRYARILEFVRSRKKKDPKA